MLYILICRAVRFQKGARYWRPLSISVDGGAACTTAWVGRLVNEGYAALLILRKELAFPDLIAVHAVRGTVRKERVIRTRGL